MDWIARRKALQPAAVLVFLVLFVIHTPTAELAQPAGSPGGVIGGLEPDQTVMGRLASGRDEVRYLLTVNAGQCVPLVVEQHGIDVVVQILGAGAPIAELQDDITNGGTEHVGVVATAPVAYVVRIAPAPGIVAPGSYAIRLGVPRAATDADRALWEARTLRTTAVDRWDRDDFAGAASLFERALTLTEGARGPDHLEVADVAMQLANVSVDRRDLERAEALYQRALAITDKTLGADHAAAGVVRMRLSKLYRMTGDRVRAESLIRQAYNIVEKTLGVDHIQFVHCLMTMATLRDDAGDFGQAVELTRRQQAILERLQYADSILYGMVLNNLGSLYEALEDYPRAEETLQRSLALGEKLRGPNAYFLSGPVVNLGIVARDRKDYPKAAAYYSRAIAIRERVLGAENPELVLLLNNLANVYTATGDEARALEVHFRALRIEEKGLGPYHRNTLLTVSNIANIYAGRRDVPKAIAYFQRMNAIIEKQLALNLAIGSERQKLAFVRSMTARTEKTIALQLRDGTEDPEASRMAATVLLQRKGRVLDAMIDAIAASRRVADPKDQALLDQLNSTTAQLARLALNAPQGIEPDARQRQMADLEAAKERLESAVGEHSAEFRAQVQPVTLEAVQAALPEQTALLEFAVFRPADPKDPRNADVYGPPRYAAYVVRKEGAPRGVDLGDAKAIDEAIDALRETLRDPASRDLRSRARALDELIARPLRAAIGDASRVLISPDGDLNLVPFDALVDEQGRYLVERYAISYLTSGRDLLRMQVARASHSAPVIVADPLFGEPSWAGTAAARRPSATLATRGANENGAPAALSPKPAAASAPSTGSKPASIAAPASSAAKLASAHAARRSITTSDDMSTLYFAPLVGTAAEGRAIKALFPEATLFTGSRATKAALRGVDGPRVLHIASHGFFLHESTGATVKVENPLLRSGLALAGANLTGAPAAGEPASNAAMRNSTPLKAGGASATPDALPEDGILTALEASSLNLWGTKLVTLSACDTGLGEVRNGEGVYGLRRAFVLAGAETLVMSLWPVSDYVTREMMTAYYTGLRVGLGRGDALRQAKLAMLKRPGPGRRHPFQHPFYWASFIQSGEWANLDGQRPSPRP